MMRTPHPVRALLAALLAALPMTLWADPLTPAFSYRGYIEEAGSPVNGFLDLELELFDAQDNGNPLGNPLTLDIVGVENGDFTVALDFGDAPFTGERVWLEVRARPGGTSEPFTTLTPRQEIRAVPYATHAQFVGAGAISSLEIENGSIQNEDLQTGAVTTPTIAPGAVTPDKLSFVPGDITEITAGAGLLGGGSAGSAELSLDPTAIPPTIQGQCPAGEALTGIAPDGQLNCSPMPTVASGLARDALTVVSGTKSCTLTSCSLIVSCQRPALAIAGGWVDFGFYETVLKESQRSGPHAWRFEVETVNSNALFSAIAGSVVCVASDWPDSR